MSVSENVAQVRKSIETAALRVGRDSSEILLMAVSKTFPARSIREAYHAGIRHFGENRVQEFAGKIDDLRDLAEARWHMIGHLQSNKAAKAAELFHAVDSVDSVKLAERLNEAASKAKRNLTILIEINVGGESAKSGIAPESPELDQLLSAAPRFEYLTISGLMTIPPFFEDPGAARPYFRKLRDLRDRITGRRLAGVNLEVLSMGMSHDFDVAVEEGSTCVRVGTAIFGERTPRP